MTIKIKYHKGAIKIAQHGNWIDLFPRKTYNFKPPKINNNTDPNGDIIFDSQLIDLGISMHLPKYFEAHVIPRSSTYIKQGIIQANHFGLIDSEYSGEEDIWMFPAIALKETLITPEKAICQFRIQLSMDAPWYIKLKWLFTNKIKFVEVDVLNGKNRGGFGTTDE